MQDGSHLSEQEMRKAALEDVRFHFMFNSLNAIRCMIYRDQDKAYSMVHDLAVFMRGQIENALSHDMIQLSEELRCARAYVMLEQVQNSNMEVEWLCSRGEGYVLGGAVCSAAEAVIKKYIRGAEGRKKLVVEEISDWYHAVLIWVTDEGKDSSVMVMISDTKEIWEPQESQGIK